jgi:hypothetical protein
MEYELQLKPFVEKEGWKYKTIQITDIALHTAHKQPTPSIGKKIAQAFKFKKPGRIYAPIDNTAESPAQRIAVIDLLKKDPDFLKMVQDEEKNGYKILLALPKEIPVVAGKDTIEFIASSNGQRILRGLAKNN